MSRVRNSWVAGWGVRIIGPTAVCARRPVAVSRATWTRWICAATNACSATAAESGAAARHFWRRRAPGRAAGDLVCSGASRRAGSTGDPQRCLRGFADVEFRLGDVRDMGLPAASFDVVLVHWMLHDVPPWDRPSIVAELARLLRPGGRLSTREPTGTKHGMPAQQVREVYAAAGLTETLARRARRRSWARTTARSGRSRRPEAGRAVAASAGPCAYARKPANVAGFLQPPPLRGSPETPPDSGSGISTTNERGQTFRGPSRISPGALSACRRLQTTSRRPRRRRPAQATGCCCVTQWMLPSALASSSVGSWTTVRRGKRRARMSRAASSAGSPKPGTTTPPLAT